MKNRRIVSAILLITMALLLTACGEKTAPAGTTAAQTTEAASVTAETAKAEETTTEETTTEETTTEETTTEEITEEETTISKEDLLNEAQQTSPIAMINAFADGTMKDYCNIPIILKLCVYSFEKDYVTLVLSMETPQIGFDAYLPEEDLAAIKEGDIITIAAIVNDIQDRALIQPDGIPLTGPHYVMETAYLIEVSESQAE